MTGDLAASIYVHIPFCTRKCPYCHFYVTSNTPSLQTQLQEGLLLEWEQKRALLEGKKILSIYFGGGTPSLFPEGIAEFLSRAKNLSSSCEITLEANPEEVTPLLLERFLTMGINRLSFGIQSLDDSSLQTLERIHTAQKGKQALWMARKAGFQNISIDLMYDLPFQTEESWNFTLDQLPDLPIEHLSLYNLTIEPKTPFFKRQKSLQFPTAKESLRFLETGIAKIEKANLKRYEISAFSKPSFASKHNLGYWQGRPFLGFGPSAFSDWGQSRFQNICSLPKWSQALKQGKSPIDFSEKLPFLERKKEEIAVGLRVLEGIDKQKVPPEILQNLQTLCFEGLLEEQGPQIRLTKRGTLFYDTIAAAII